MTCPASAFTLVFINIGREGIYRGSCADRRISRYRRVGPVEGRHDFHTSIVQSDRGPNGGTTYTSNAKNPFLNVDMSAAAAGAHVGCSRAAPAGESA